MKVDVLSGGAGTVNIVPVDGQLARRAHIVVVGHVVRRRGRGCCEVAVEGGLVWQGRDVHGIRHKVRRGIRNGRGGDAFPSDWRGGYAFCCCGGV